jgi:hypothetical protein
MTLHATLHFQARDRLTTKAVYRNRSGRLRCQRHLRYHPSSKHSHSIGLQGERRYARNRERTLNFEDVPLLLADVLDDLDT